MNGRLRILAGVLVLCLGVCPLVWWTFLRKPPVPMTTDADVLRKYWRNRIQSDVSDVAAYTALGALQERTGFYSEAVRHLQIARALGASDLALCGPLGRALTALARDDEALPELQKAQKLAPDSLDALIDLAGLSVNQNDSVQAANLMRDFAAVHPNLSTGDARRLAFNLLQCGDSGAAWRLADSVLANEPADPLALSIAARGAMAANDLPASRHYLETLLAQAKDDAGVHFLYGRVLDAQGDKKGALTQWEETVRLNPNALDAREQIALAAAQSSDNKRAAAEFELLAQRAPSTPSAFRAAESLERIGDKPRAAYWRAVSLGFGGRFADALTQAKIATASPDPALKKLGLQAEAEAYRGLRQKAAYLDAMMRLSADGSVPDLLLRAKAHAEADEHEKRTESLNAAAQKTTDPNQKAAILFSLSQAYGVRGMKDDAEKSLAEAVRIAPGSAALHHEFAKVLFARRALGDNLTRAIAEWETAVSLAPDESAYWLKLGIAYAAANQTGKSLSRLEHALDLEPGSGPVYQELSRQYSRLGDRENAQRMNLLYGKYVAFDQRTQTARARARRPNAAASDLIEYGDILVKTGALEEAAHEYELARKLLPSDVPLRRKLASLYGRLRMPERQQVLLAAG